MNRNQMRQVVNVRFFHATPQVSAVDVYINDQLIQRGLAYQQTTDYFPVAKGTYHVHLVDPETGTPLLSQRVTINDNRYITIIAVAETNQVGLLSLPDKSMKPGPVAQEPTILPQVQTTPTPMVPTLGEFNLPSQQVRKHRAEEVNIPTVPVRVVHLSPNAPSVDVFLSQEPLFRDVIYKEATSYVDLVPRAYQLSVRSHQNGQEVLVLPELVIRPDRAHTIYITGLVGGTPKLEVIVLDDGI